MHKVIFLLTGLVMALPASVTALEAPTLDHGRALFEMPGLGTRQKSCSTCHPDGKGLDKVGDFSDIELKDIINACIRDSLGGELLDLESQELNSLLLYVRPFQKN